MSEKLKRRWFQFRLWQMFVVVTILGLWFGWNVQRVKLRAATLAHLRTEESNSIQSGQSAPWRDMPIVWYLLGADPVSRIYLGASYYNEEDRTRIQRLFPEAIVVRN